MWFAIESTWREAEAPNVALGTFECLDDWLKASECR
jgi:hypothetical protein